MKCFLHLDYDPLPKEASSPVEAFCMAESMLGEDDEEPSSIWRTLWRRDELYPNNFVNYRHEDLLEELQVSGSVVLQRVCDDGGIGRSVEIFTDDLERRNDEEAQEALRLKTLTLEVQGLSRLTRMRQKTA